MQQYIEEELTLSELSERFLNLSDYSTPCEYDMNSLEIEVLSKNLETGQDEYKKIKSFVVKPEVHEYYTNGQINVAGNHQFIVEMPNLGLAPSKYDTLFASQMNEFNKIEKNMKVVDIEVEDNHNYLANGQINHNTTSGGKALGYHASVRLKTSSVGKIKDKNDVVIGNKMKVEVVKNRIGPPFRKAEFEMYYDSGLDNYSGWITVLKEHKVINQSGSTYTFDLPMGLVPGQADEVKFMSRDFRELLESRPEVRDYLYSQMCNILIMKYKKPGEVRIDDELSLDEKDTSGLDA
jgi:hypothetical protein